MGDEARDRARAGVVESWLPRYLKIESIVNGSATEALGAMLRRKARLFPFVPLSLRQDAARRRDARAKGIRFAEDGLGGRSKADMITPSSKSECGRHVA